MVTLRHVERLFSEQKHSKLYRELIAGRPEADSALEVVLARTVPVAALGIIRLDELNQSQSPLYRRLLNVVLTAQQADGGWDDPIVSALCLRALICGHGQGAAIERGLTYLASLQQPQATWPREPLRRMPPDALATAFILLQLGEFSLFRDALRFDDAVDWCAHNAPALDPITHKLWSHAAVRCRAHRHSAAFTLWARDRSAA
jgi:hypothetical protein